MAAWTVSLKYGRGLTVNELAQVAVARISVGPITGVLAMEEQAKNAHELLEQAEL